MSLEVPLGFLSNIPLVISVELSRRNSLEKSIQISAEILSDFFLFSIWNFFSVLKKSSMDCFVKFHMEFLQRKSCMNCFINFTLKFFTWAFQKNFRIYFQKLLQVFFLEICSSIHPEASQEEPA